MDAAQPRAASGRLDWLTHPGAPQWRLGIAAVPLAAIIAITAWSSATLFISFDEAYNLTLSQTLAEDGRYAVRTGDGRVDFDPIVSTGPTTLVPVALAFRLAGVSIEASRFVLLAFAVTAWVLVFLVARKSYGLLAAGVAPLLLLLAPVDNGLMGVATRTMGEIPGAVCLVGGVLWWRDGRGSRWRLIAAGVLAGLAILSKWQNVAAVSGAGALVLCWVVQRRTPVRSLLIPAAVCGLCLAAWQATVYAGLGGDGYEAYFNHLRSASEAVRVGLTDAGGETGDRLTHSLLGAFLLAGAAAALRGMRRPGHEPGALLGVMGLALASGALMSIPVRQYLVPAVILLAVPAAGGAARLASGTLDGRTVTRGVALAAATVAAVLLGLQAHRASLLPAQSLTLPEQKEAMAAIDRALPADAHLLRYGFTTPWEAAFLMDRLVYEARRHPPGSGEVLVMTPHMKRIGYDRSLAPFLDLARVEHGLYGHDLYIGLPRTLTVSELRPASTRVGVAFWPVPDGRSRLALVCAGCHPSVTVTFDGVALRTDYLAHDSIVAYVLPEMLARPGTHTVVASDAHVSSAPLTFEVLAP